MKEFLQPLVIVSGALLTAAVCQPANPKPATAAPRVAENDLKNDPFVLSGAQLLLSPGVERKEVLRHLPKPAMTGEDGTLWYRLPEKEHDLFEDGLPTPYVTVRFYNDLVTSVERSELRTLRRFPSVNSPEEKSAPLK